MPALVRPALPLMASFAQALREGYSRDNLRAETPDAIAAAEREPEWLLGQILNPPTTVVLPDGSLSERVPETVLWYADGETFLGSVQLRHRLTPLLEQWGGHIGYAVRPSARGRGYASAMLAGMLDHCRTHHPELETVMLTAVESNPASIRVIEKNGGVLQGRIAHPWHSDEMGRQYRIGLT